MNPSVRCEVIDVEAISEYRGSVYERTVKIRAKHQQIECFEGKGHVLTEDCGKMVNLVLLAQMCCNGSNVTTETNKGIKQPSESDEERSQWRSVLTGKIVEKNKGSKWLQGGQNDRVILDVGIGTVIVKLCDELREQLSEESINIGSMIQIECGRLDIIGRHNINP